MSAGVNEEAPIVRDLARVQERINAVLGVGLLDVYPMETRAGVIWGYTSRGDHGTPADRLTRAVGNMRHAGVFELVRETLDLLAAWPSGLRAERRESPEKVATWQGFGWKLKPPHWIDGNPPPGTPAHMAPGPSHASTITVHDRREDIEAWGYRVVGGPEAKANPDMLALEFDAMRSTLAAWKPLDEAARDRVWSWVNAHLEVLK